MSGLVSRFSASSRRIGRSLAVIVVSATAIVSCGDVQKGAVPKLDHAADVMPFPAPAVAAQLGLSGVPALPRDAQETLELRRAFFAGDFARVESAMNDAHEKTLGGQSAVPAAELDDALSGTQLAGIDSCARWLEAMPKSYAAHWLCAAICFFGPQVCIARGALEGPIECTAELVLSLHKKLREQGHQK